MPGDTLSTAQVDMSSPMASDDQKIAQNFSALSADGGIKAIYLHTETIDVASIAAGAELQVTVTPTGWAEGDVCIGVQSSDTAIDALVMTSWSQAAGIILNFHNPTAGAIDPASHSMKFIVART